MPKTNLSGRNFAGGDEYLTVISRLRTARRAQGMTQEELAHRIERDQSFISKLERGERRLALFDALLLCEALDVSLSYLLPARWDSVLCEK